MRETNAHATGGDATDSRKSNVTRQSEVETDTVNSSLDDSGLLNDSTLRKWQLTQTIYHHWIKLSLRVLCVSLLFGIAWLLVDSFVFRIDNPYTGKYNLHGLINGGLMVLSALIGLCICFSIDNSSVNERPGLERRLAKLAILYRLVFIVVIVLEVFVVVLILTKGNDYTISSSLLEATQPASQVQHGVLHITYKHSPL